MRRSILLLPLAFGCAPAFQLTAPAMHPAPADAAVLARAADAYYDAGTPAAMRAAVEEARKAGPDSAIYHELAASLARFDADLDAEVDHYLAALLDPQNDAAALHLLHLDDLPLTLEQRRRVDGLLETLRRDHPNPAVRALAAHQLGDRLRARGQLELSASVRASAGTHLPFALIGVWDNDQGKGFDTEHEPERSLDMSARYPGTVTEVGWRLDPPRSPFGADYNLGQLFSPDTWALGYAVSTFRVAQGGSHQLRVTSSVPIKVWVNGSLVFSERRVEDAQFDQFVLPVELAAGTNRVLVKSAQNEGGWVLMARLTDPQGNPVATEPVKLDAPIDPRAPKNKPIPTSKLLDLRTAKIAAGARRDFHRLDWARLLGLAQHAVALGDAFVQHHPKSIVGRYTFIAVTWDQGERSRTSDVLADLAEKDGEALPYLIFQHSRFLLQEGLTRKARESLEHVQKKHPDNPELWSRLARQFDAEGWPEDHCAALAHAEKLRPGWESVLMDLAACRRGLGFEKEAVGIYEEILRELPLHQNAISQLETIALGNEELEQAEALALQLVKGAPDQTWTWFRLAEVRRRRGDRAGAEEALKQASAIDPDASAPYAELARIAYQGGDREAAIQRWKTALMLNPEDEKLANRLSYLAPEKLEPWEKEVPDEDALEKAVASRAHVKPVQGADVLDLLDHEVTRINSDGSTTNFVTHVSHALNQSGRDQLTQEPLPGGGRLRILHAYAIDPDGTRTQVSNIRGHVARFRGLKIGSTIVLQYRHDARPVGYLAKHVARGWWFQTLAHQVELSQWVVWADKGTMFHEWVQGDVQRTEEQKGQYMRLSWSARDVPPLLPEPGMPTLSETAMNMLVSTVPSWDAYLEWEKALLSEAFEESAEVKDLAMKLVAGATTPEEKIERIPALPHGGDPVPAGLRGPHRRRETAPGLSGGEASLRRLQGQGGPLHHAGQAGGRRGPLHDPAYASERPASQGRSDAAVRSRDRVRARAGGARRGAVLGSDGRRARHRHAPCRRPRCVRARARSGDPEVHLARDSVSERRTQPILGHDAVHSGV